MGKEYVEEPDGGYLVAGTRVSLDSVVYAFLRGTAAESIAQSYPVLSLEEVYGAIAYYLAHQAEVDAMLASHEDIVKGILRREPGIDFQTATSAGLRGLRDWEVLELAATKVASWFPITVGPCPRCSRSS
jgi:uncharacterized protein (DUF433 family)